MSKLFPNDIYSGALGRSKCEQNMSSRERESAGENWEPRCRASIVSSAKKKERGRGRGGRNQLVQVLHIGIDTWKYVHSISRLEKYLTISGSWS